jgi:hypothetical protein
MTLKSGKGLGEEALTQTSTVQTRPEACHHSYGCQAPSQQSPLSLPLWTNKTRLPEKGEVKNRHSFEPLKTEFTFAGFTYRRICREGDRAIYEQSWRGSENVAYEVVRIRRQKARTFPSGRSYPEREVYPRSEAWGKDGFTLTDKDAAFKKLSRLTNLEQAGDVLELD